MVTLDIHDSASACKTKADVLSVSVRVWNVQVVPYALSGSGIHALVECVVNLIGHWQGIPVGGRRS